MRQLLKTAPGTAQHPTRADDCALATGNDRRKLETVSKMRASARNSERARQRTFRGLIAAIAGLALIAGAVLALGAMSGLVLGPGDEPVGPSAAPQADSGAEIADKAGGAASRIPPTPSPTPTIGPSPGASAVPGPSTDDPASLAVVVNKLRPLRDVHYVPPDLVAVPVPHTRSPLLRQEASDAVVAMFAAASAEAGLSLSSNSAYRSFEAQERVYTGFVASLGQSGADATSARPGHSEHQTGLSLDVGATSGKCVFQACFGETAEGNWLAANATRFGFVLRFPADKTAVTGYEYEPWHFRYVGVDVAGQMRSAGARTLEEFFGLPAAPDYAR